MGRHKKAGLTYFPLDISFFDDPRIRRLIARFGADGPLFYLYILGRAYSNSYYVKYDDDFAEDAALYVNCSVEKIGLMLHYLLDKSLLDGTLFRTVKVLSSHGIQIQYQEIKKDLRRDIEVDGDSWILDESETEGFIKVRSSLDKSGGNENKSGRNEDKPKKNALKESKGKERKIKGNTFAPARVSIPTFEQVLEAASLMGCQEHAKAFFDYYAAAGWRDSEGKPVFSWRQKLVAWRMREEKRSGNGARAAPQAAPCRKGRLVTDENGEEVVVFD